MKNVFTLLIVTGFLFASIPSLANESESMTQPEYVENEIADDSDIFYNLDEMEDEYYDDTNENWDENWDTEWDAEYEAIENTELPEVENLNNY